MHAVIKPALALSAAVLLVSGHASAQERITVSSSNFYAGVEAGLVIPQDVGFSANSTRGGTTTTGSGKFEFDAGYSVAALGGYKINPYVAAEAEIGYASFDYNKVTGNFTATNGGSSATVSGSAKLDGSVDSVIGLARGIVSPLGDRPIRPLIGGGVGFASTSEKINKIGTTAVNASTDHTDLALEGTVGLEADIGLSTTLGARYRYMWINSGNEGLDNFAAHNMVGTLAYKF